MAPAPLPPDANRNRWRRWLPWGVGVFLLLIPLAFRQQALSAEAPTWNPAGEQIGALRNVTVASDEGLTLLYRWSSAGVWRSADDGRTWAAVGAGLPRSLLGGPTLLELRGGPPRTLYALAGPAASRSLYRSLDSGANFELFYRPTNFNPSLLAVAATDNQLALSDGTRVSLSRDGGITWEDAIAPKDITTLHLDERLWAAGPGWAGFNSSPGETDWQITSLPSDIRPLQFIAPRRSPGQLYLQHERGYLRTDDNGATWRSLNLPHAQITALAVDPVVWQTLYAGDETGDVWRSDNAGETWQRIDGPSTGVVHSLFVAPGLRDRLDVISGFDQWWIQQLPLQPTPTATSTHTPTPTATPSLTPTALPSATVTLTPSPTEAPPASPTSTPIARRATNTPSPTPTPDLAEATPTPQPSLSTGAPPPPSATPTVPAATPTPTLPTPIPTPTRYR